MGGVTGATTSTRGWCAAAGTLRVTAAALSPPPAELDSVCRETAALPVGDAHASSFGAHFVTRSGNVNHDDGLCTAAMEGCGGPPAQVGASGESTPAVRAAARPRGVLPVMGGVCMMWALCAEVAAPAGVSSGSQGAVSAEDDDMVLERGRGKGEWCKEGVGTCGEETERVRGEERDEKQKTCHCQASARSLAGGGPLGEVFPRPCADVCALCT